MNDILKSILIVLEKEVETLWRFEHSVEYSGNNPKSLNTIEK